MIKFEYRWSDIVFGNKNSLKDLDAIFIAAPREMSIARITQLLKKYLPISNIIIGCATELYIDSFDGQPQFKTLQSDGVKDIARKVNNSASPHKITILHYSQSDFVHILNKIKFRLVLLVNGSWHNSFHTRPEYHVLVSKNTRFELISPFTDENEAIQYADNFKVSSLTNIIGSKLTELEMIQAANKISANSFDNAHQTGLSVGKKINGKYKLVMTSYNLVVPYQTFAWHFGASRERHLSPPGDLNYYDTVHAEVYMLLQAQQNGLQLTGLSLFINLLPCPTCARMLCKSDISEIVYSLDHSGGYAVAMLEKAGKTVRRLIDNDNIIKTEG